MANGPVLWAPPMLMSGSVGSLSRELPAALPGEGDLGGVFRALGPTGWTACLWAGKWVRESSRPLSSVWPSSDLVLRTGPKAERSSGLTLFTS